MKLSHLVTERKTDIIAQPQQALTNASVQVQRLIKYIERTKNAKGPGEGITGEQVLDVIYDFGMLEKDIQKLKKLMGVR